MKIWKDYELVGTRLYKFNVNENKHLLKNYGGVPAIDKNIWNKLEKGLTGITVKTNLARTFRISRDEFNAHKIEVEYCGFGKQYVVPFKKWTVSSKQSKLFEDALEKPKKIADRLYFVQKKLPSI